MFSTLASSKHKTTMAIKLAVFDMAGTTVYDKGFVHIAFIQGMQSKGFEVTHDEVNPLMGLHKPQAIRIMLEKRMDPATITEEFVMEIHDVFEQNMVNFYTSDPSVREIEGSSAVFQKLHDAGIKVALDTGFGRKITDTIIKRLGWDKGLVDASCASDEVERGRPYPDMIKKIMAELDIEHVEDIAKTGDTPVDLEEGQNTNCSLVIGVTSGAYTGEALAEYYHTHIVPSVVEAGELILAN
jgi:phosphonatase-like hydrolase